MHEESKLKEAAYFYSRVVAAVGNREHLMFDLSAFLSAARSVLQYAHKEALRKRGGQQWYNRQIASAPVSQFLRNKRDINIHSQPIKVSQHTSLQLTEGAHVSESINIKKFEGGKLIGEYISEPSELTAAPEVPPKVSHRYTLMDWPGTEDIFQLCDTYLKELRRIVTDGQSRSFLSM